jgi:NADPH:quinone reductase-like Zn-dependent oxidoreductase
LINGATGRVGSHATQIARAPGVRVIASARAGQLRAPMAEAHAFDRIDDAFSALARGALGKIAITVLDGS